MNKPCLICERIADIKEDKNPHFVKELKTGYVVLGDHQFYKGYTLFLFKNHIKELHELDNDTKTSFLLEMSKVAEAVYKTFSPTKLNYELLGNAFPHMHWHLFPRYVDDLNINMPVWTVDKAIRNNDKYKIEGEELQELKNKLLNNLNS